MRQDNLHALGITFTSPALDPESVRVHEIHGREEISKLYEFTVRFVHLDGPLRERELDALLKAPCSFTLGAGDDATYHGIVREVEFVEALEGHGAHYVAVVVPRLWLLSMSKVSRVFQEMTVAEMAQEILQNYGLAGKHDLEPRLLGGQKREFCVQYEETDLDFLHRWFEHEGFYYWFEQGAGAEKLVIADHAAASRPIADDATLPFRDLGGLVRTEDSVFRWSFQKRRVPAGVVLKDYNDQNPLVPLVGRAEVDRSRGFGVVFEYGDHFETAAAGTAIAKKRAERFLTEQGAARGISDCTRLRAGSTFELVDHLADDQNREYLVTVLEHHVGRIDPLLEGRAPEDDRYGYRAYFDVIPRAVQYRPARTASWPAIHGIMHGHVDSDASGVASTLDRQGRYRVRLPFDLSGNRGERASCWVRMAQSYAGTGYGSHYPLHKGTEVVLAFLDGDPDRPIIVGAISNAYTPGPSASRNATQSGVRSASGIHFVMEDVNPPSSSRSHN